MEQKQNDQVLLSIRDLEVQYRAGGEIVRAVNGVSFDLERGKTLGLVGETGAGKTTTALGIMGIIPNPPGKIISGEIILDGENLLECPEKRMRQIRGNEISMIFQDPMTALNPIFRVGEQIEENIKVHNPKLSDMEVAAQAVEMLKMVGIPAERAYEYPHQFSGGMKQRVIIAMALACNPELLLADEPTTALDVTIQAQVLDMMTKLKDRFNTAMIMITHDMGIVAETCDQVSVMYAGEVVESGSVFQIFDNPSHPYTKLLFSSIPSLDNDVERLNPIPGLTPNPMFLPDGCKFHPRCPMATKECGNVSPDVIEIEQGHCVRCLRYEKEAGT